MTITKNNFRMIYESPDGGKTVYARDSLSGERELIKVDPSVLEKNRWFKWKEILAAAENCPSLSDAISKAEMIYELTKSNK
jgi:hypothetical protein